MAIAISLDVKEWLSEGLCCDVFNMGNSVVEIENMLESKENRKESEREL